MKMPAAVDDVMARTRADSSLQAQICDALESIADNLPVSIDTDLACRLPGILTTSWAEHVSLYEEAIFQILKRHHASTPSIVQAIEALEAEHSLITDTGLEVVEQLELPLSSLEPNISMIGYMIRGAFQDRRRHLESEQRLIEELLPATLAPVDRDLLAAWLRSHSWPRGLSDASFDDR